VSLLAGFAAVYFLKASLLGTAFFSDDFGYHAVAVARWTREEEFCLPMHDLMAYYPYNSELMSMWFVLPFHHDAWAGLAGLYWAGLVAFSAAGLCLARNLKLPTAIMVATLAICSPGIMWQARTFSATDLAGSAMMLAALFFTAQTIGEIANGKGIAGVAYAGLLVGLAIGSKISYAPIFLLMFAWLALSNRGQAGKAHIMRVLVIFAISSAATGSFWYLRNWLMTGNPIFPAEWGPFSGPFTREQQSEVKLITYLIRESHEMSYWFSLSYAYLDWPFGIGLLSLIGYVSGIVSEFGGSTKGDSKEFTIRRMLLASGLLLAICHPFLPFSHGGGEVNGVLVPFPRYLTSSFLIGIALFGNLIDRSCKWRWFWRSIALIALVTCWPGPGMSTVAAIAGSGLGLSVLYCLSMGFMRHLRPQAVGTFVIVAVLIGWSLNTKHQKWETDRNVRKYGSEKEPIGSSWMALEDLPAGSRVACLANRTYERSPLFGRQYQLDMVEIMPDGSASRSIHERYLDDKSYIIWGNEDPLVNSAQFVNNLLKARIDYILVSKWKAEKWPLQYDRLLGSDRLEVIYQDSYSVLWKVK
jgi:hypothetical protein